MNHSAIHALRRLRQYQLEKEQWLLQARQREEMERTTATERTRGRFTEEMSVDPGDHIPLWKRRADGVRELGRMLEQNQRQLRLAKQARNDQIQTVLGAQRRVEIIDRLLQRDAEQRAADRDQTERKLLDDLAAAKASRLESKAGLQR